MDLLLFYVTIRARVSWDQMIITETPIEDRKEVIDKTLSDETIWELCKTRAEELNIPAWKIAESIPWH